MRVHIVSISVILMSIALVSAATASPAGSQGKEKNQSVVGTITAIDAKGQTITVTPFSPEQLQNQQSQPSQGEKDAAPSSYVFRLDQSTEIVGGKVMKKGKVPVVVKKKGVAQDDSQAGPSADQKDQAQAAGGTQTSEQAQTGQVGQAPAVNGKAKKGMTEQADGKLDLLQVGLVVAVAYTAVEGGASAQQTDQGQTTAVQVPAKKMLKKGATDSPAGLLAKNIRVMSTVSPTVSGVQVSPPAAPQPAAPPSAPTPPSGAD
jgi:hypothetical protein